MEITFKPAPLRSAQSWLLSGKVLDTPSGQQIDLSKLTGGRCTDLPSKRFWIAEFQLSTASDTVTIKCNDVKTGIQRQNYYTLVFEIVESLKLHNPNVKIQRGTNQLFNVMFAAIGLIPLGFGLSFIISALQNGGDGFGIGLGCFFLLLAAFIVWCASPWQKPPVSTPTELQAWLRSWVGGRPDGLPPG
ncbi:MAG: hypothetical protein AAF329_25475 [Cyanobacteria bacterium P01_A01_bin.17]